jgi:hypothetical protein
MSENPYIFQAKIKYFPEADGNSVVSYTSPALTDIMEHLEEC